ncbi:phytanoyl-CoA dioxygenase family protein [Paracidovorax konjaci]|uniref:Ectoine hydroxylase-related dioxygenase, phytanoyl-CoA dioxygenase (PhyH) family n=1 Tax=Paracidovorax konjaci TaxID=32040 RepID=A0A1I1WNN3_9BURK|nr:phytanoyl-CoA dioxygenase family protein [Paracidovorax konjaci]SFD96736.1 Ectoine hydroxylase-related dioxygenase, phytanoyl-CoA dioxygenase (PhyH) family [Paracidovorax konjaci]
MTEIADNAVGTAARATSALGIPALEQVWSRMAAAHTGRAASVTMRQAQQDHWVLHAAGIGLEPFYAWFGKHGGSFDAFERWVVDRIGIPPADRAERLNAALAGAPPPRAAQEAQAAIEAMPPVLSGEDLAFWDENGYVVLHDAITPQAAQDTASVVWKFIGARPDDPATWYPPNEHGIMVQLFHDAVLERNRQSPRIRKAFSQLWGTADLWSTTDRVGFNAPETASHRFRGPHLHWDVSLQTPVPLGTQGILYLTDTQAQQGAFTLVPGFHRRLGAWLDSLPGGPSSARQQDLDSLGAEPIAGRAGDLIIWHHALPHGSRPNTTDQPRLVQYINLFPADAPVHEGWV